MVNSKSTKHLDKRLQPPTFLTKEQLFEKLHPQSDPTSQILSSCSDWGSFVPEEPVIDETDDELANAEFKEHCILE